MQVEGRVSQPQRKRIKQALLKSEFFQDCLATKEVKLKAGAQVILVKNTYVRKGAMLPNGARGVIIAMVPKIKILRKLRLDSESLAALKSFEGNLLPQVIFTNGMHRIIAPTEFTHAAPGMGNCTRYQVIAWDPLPPSPSSFPSCAPLSSRPFSLFPFLLICLLPLPFPLPPLVYSSSFLSVLRLPLPPLLSHPLHPSSPAFHFPGTPLAPFAVETHPWTIHGLHVTSWPVAVPALMTPWCRRSL
mmetsp:Transcript_25051/g.69946  ORF Transcript_25051/g.69946 Transcript_25051/m.69946 type:complete len:245 (-) Transcript_25051:1168-1902(-)